MAKRRKCRDCNGSGIWYQYTSVYYIKMTHNCNRCGGTGDEPINYEDVKVGNGYVGVTEIVGKKIKEIKGDIISDQFGEYAFQMIEIEFEDGSTLHCDGEHKIAYLKNCGSSYQPNFDGVKLYNVWADIYNPHHYIKWKTIIDYTMAKEVRESEKIRSKNKH